MTLEAKLNDHQPAPKFDLDADAEKAPTDSEASTGAPMVLLEPDFSLLQMARATLDRAFPRG